MKLAIDIEANGLFNPTKIWCICCIDVDTGKEYVFRNPTDDEEAKASFIKLAEDVETFIGHNFLGYDYDCILSLLGCDLLRDFPETFPRIIDTLILSKLIDYSRDKHSIEDYGREFNIPKSTYVDYTKYSLLLEERCIIDTKISLKVYLKYLKYISKVEHIPSIILEHKFQLIVNTLHTNGFSFNKDKASKLLSKVEEELKIFDVSIQKEFLPKLTLVREVTPKETKYGTLSKTDFRFLPKLPDGSVDLSDFNGGPFCRGVWSDFNPASHKQVVEVLHTAGWSPTDKTQTHIDTERELNRLKYQHKKLPEVDLAIKECHTKLQSMEKYGWKINENNLATLPSTVPSPARLLAKRILYESRRRTLTEWLGLVQPDGRIHGTFYGLGAWTHRMAHQKPNTANIPNEFDTNNNKKLLGKEMRSLWQAPRNRLLVGVDAEGIQLRIFAHYVNSPDLIKALVEGDKKKETDPHSYNKGVLGKVCKSRQAAKRFVYALFLGAGLGKLAFILECTKEEAAQALERLISQYPGFEYLKSTIIPEDAKRGWFTGIDGRRVRIPGTSLSERKHLAMSGYLQNGEAVVVKQTVIQTIDRLLKEKINAIIVNIVHDEVIFEVPNDVAKAEYVSKVFCEEIVEVGNKFNLKCPLAGDGHVGLSWYEVH